MRLIDADTLQLNLRVPSKNNEIVKAFENSVINALYAQPTVEAIPIEWINQWQEKQYCLQDEGKARITVIEMLSDWRKENAGILQRD